MTFKIEIEALGTVADYFEGFPVASAKAARLAINQVAQRQALRDARRAMYDEVNFPSGYLNDDRLYVKRFATEANLEAIIVGRKRATSLARFADSATPLGSAMRAGVRVKVKTKGGGEHLKKAWLVRLRRGASKTEDNFNLGLAVRVKSGEKIVGKYTEHTSWLVPGQVALLYGPSVDQVFRSVAEDLAPQILDAVSAEFHRQFARLL
jgi:hypothetical protein